MAFSAYNLDNYVIRFFERSGYEMLIGGRKTQVFEEWGMISPPQPLFSNLTFLYDKIIDYLLAAFQVPRNITYQNGCLLLKERKYLPATHSVCRHVSRMLSKSMFCR